MPERQASELSADGAADPILAESVREELGRILASHEFRSSKRSQDFLRYVIQHVLEGHPGSLKERTIGMEVFGRPASYDPSEDATVRVKAGEVRKRLGLYYAGPHARGRVRIELPVGTYIPEFRSLDVDPEPSATALVSGVHEPDRRRGRRIWRASLVLLLLCAAAGAWYWTRTRGTNPILDEFWAPVLRGTAPVSLCAAYVPVYARNGDSNADQPARVQDFIQLTDQFVGGGDLVAVSRLSAMLTRLQRPYRVRIGSDVTFPDLRTAPAILVGYSYTRWKEISSAFRYVIDTEHRTPFITDNGKETPWALPNLPADRRTTEDYAIVSRVFHPDTRAMMVEIAGITQYGTDAAGDLVTNPDLLAEAMRGAPAGWQSRNLQIVLHVKVISGTPSSPRVLATHFW